MPVGVRPPCVKISHVPGATARASMLATQHWLPKRSAMSATSSGRATAALLTATLSAPASSSARASSAVRDAAADGERHEADFGGARDHVEQRAAAFMAGGDVEEAELVCPGGVIGARGLDRIARVAQIDEVDAFDDAAVLDVEAGDDADADGHLLPSRLREG